MRIGIDLGGSKIEILALDDGGGTLAQRRRSTPQGDYSDTLAALVGLVREVEDELGMTGTVGVGMPGAISPATGKIKNANATNLIGHRLDIDLSVALDREVRVANDANCFALSEATDGAGAGASVVFGVIIGTGTGGGLVVNGRVLTGCNAIGGEWGHNPLPWPRGSESPGPVCYCGRRGCIEVFLSGPGLASDFFEITGKRASAAALAEQARAGEQAALDCFDRYEERMGRALAHVINIVDPDVIVLGGGLSKIERLYDNVPKYWLPYVFSDHVATRLTAPRHGDASGVRGAAWLWPKTGH